MCALVLSIYCPTAKTELHCDASSIGFGAMLLQKQNDGYFHPVAYFSRTTSETESRYHSFEQETLAIVYALERFHVYLHGIRFKVITDCNALKQTLQKKDINTRINRWGLTLQNYDFEIDNREAAQMQHVDALSRCNNILLLEETNDFEKTLVVAQLRDESILAIRKMLEERENKFYEMRNGIVYRKF